MERKYQALDIGPAAILEVFVLPLGKDMKSHTSHQDNKSIKRTASSIVVDNIPWNPNQMFFNLPPVEITSQEDKSNTVEDADMSNNNILGTLSAMNLSGKNRNEAFVSDFTNAVGGLKPQIDQIVRRVLDGRVIRPAEDDDDISLDRTQTTPASFLQQVSLEAEELIALGLQPVRGLLLYGPPGCGKTALARQVSKALRARTPKIISAPELLDRWVGGSEKLIRDLFADAEAELALCNGDATQSALHVIVIDEIDAVFRKRSAGEDSGEATRSSAVNQILAKLDGVKAIPNVLMIGMTNRRELLDEALLRPGAFVDNKLLFMFGIYYAVRHIHHSL
jgi:vesicle-fusing ATPase